MSLATLTIQLRNDLAELASVNRAWTGFVAQQQLPARLSFELGLVLDELLTNAITYGCDAQRVHQLAVRGALAESVLTLEVEDDGRPFNPLTVPPPVLDAPLLERQPGGLGLHLVRQLVDQLAYRREAERNVLTLTKRIFPVTGADKHAMY